MMKVFEENSVQKWTDGASIDRFVNYQSYPVMKLIECRKSFYTRGAKTGSVKATNFSEQEVRVERDADLDFIAEWILKG